MVSRGSSVHHMRRSSNPFMTTSSGVVGINLQEPVAFSAPRLSNDNQQQSVQSVSSIKDFMYQTTSQGLGDGFRAQDRSKLSQCMDKLTLRKDVTEKGQVKINAIDVVSPYEYALSPGDVLPPPIDTRSISDARIEHPMYATSNRDIGVEKSQVKVELDRRSRPNTFTNSFNGFRYRDFGLNTAITKSRISDQLDLS
ncbi:hypothetical protein Poli38472_001464 [Pythium oligandrum]|uniref:Uncharacterized protein n=1 Tax=Pythium oligandrum TaxID=41045 RepID=A0A8K1CW28_PYTOL|nr:hypothetical protein Poli38472_001464 [Pythium oligandrum]|eukprot:TMW69308.1 hypothetical protein Poli38472_001464 [Pythium oligandrum]